MSTLKIKELSGEEKKGLKSLWEEIFSEDKGAFADYYFQYKIMANECLIFEEEGRREAVSMLHLTPYRLNIRCGSRFCTVQVPYIVGVATKEQFRHRGLMRMLLRHTFQKLFLRNCPFAFLMPADPAIYKPFDFAYIYSRREYKVQKSSQLKAASAPSYRISVMNREELPELIAFVNSRLKANYDVFTVRDLAYYELQLKELEAMEGEIRLIRHGGRLCGYFLLAAEEGEEPFIQEAWLPKEHREELSVSLCERKKPVIMARIMNVKAALMLLRSREGEVCCTLKVEDRWLPEQYGYYRCYWDEHGARIEPIQTGEGPGEAIPAAAERKAGSALEPDAAVRIEHLTEWMFGCKKSEQCFEFLQNREDLADGLNRIAVLSNVYINEIV